MVSPLAFVDRLISLVETEQRAEEEQTSLLLSSCPFSLLVQRGLALSSLQPFQTSIGLSGRTLLDLELNPAIANSKSSGAKFPPHGFRTGDLAVMIPAGRVAGSSAGGGGGGGGEKGAKGRSGKGKGAGGGGAKGKGKEEVGVDWQKGVKGVVYKVTESRITLALGGGSAVGGGGEDDDKDEAALGTNLRLVKLANPTTFDRQTTALRQLHRLIEASQPTPPPPLPALAPPPPPALDSPTSTHDAPAAALTLQDLSEGANPAVDPRTDAPVEPEDDLAPSSSPATPELTTEPAPSTASPPRPRQPTPLSPLLKVLLGLASPSAPPPDAPPVEWIDERLNASQRDAVQFALAAPEVGLVWGPPGTGKTQTLVEVIRQLVARGERVLVCGGSNLSVDNLLERLSQPSPAGGAPIPLTRIGHPARVLSSLVPHTLDAQSSRTDAQELLGDIKGELLELTTKLNGTGKDRIKGKARRDKWGEVRELRKEFRKREGGVVKEVLGKAKVVLATTHGAGSRVLERIEFDTLIIDEAAQCVEPSCWIPILKAKRLILAGDHLQLPPTVKSAKPGEGLDKAALQKLGGVSTNEAATPTTPPSAEPAASEDELSDGYEADEERKGDATREPASAPTTEPAPAPSAPVRATPEQTIAESVDQEETVTALPSASIIPARDGLSDGGLDNDATRDSASASPTAPTSATPTPAKHFPRPRLTKSLTTTLFSRLLALHGDGLRRMLKVSYRFNAKICAFPSARLYGGELVAADAVKERRLTDLDGVDDDEMDEQVVFIDTAGAAMYERALEGKQGTYGSESKANENEAQLCVDYVDELVAAGVPTASIALVSPYNAQVTLLASLLNAKYPDGPPEVGSIDSYQGRESDVVIISLVRSNPEGAVGFLAEPRRLNVAMTRPRRQLVVVGDSETVGKGSGFLRDWMNWLEEEAVVRVAQ